MRLKINLVSVAGNLIGALLTFLYFAYINVDLKTSQGTGSMLISVVFFVIGTAFIFSVIVTINQRWSRPLFNDPLGEIIKDGPNGLYSEELRRKALQLVPMLTGTTFLGWIMAGFIFGMLMPIIFHAFFGMAPMTLTESLRRILGITVVGGFSTSLFIYFAQKAYGVNRFPCFSRKGI